MADPKKHRKTIFIFTGTVLLIAFISFFTCISLVDTSFLYMLWLPWLFIHILLAFAIRLIHIKKDKHDGVETHSPQMLCMVFCSFSTGFSMIFVSIVVSLCRDPYCSDIRLSIMDPLIVYTIIFLLEYFTLCVAFDFIFVKWTGTRNPLYRLCIQYPAILHTTTCTFTSFILWSFPIAAYISAEYSDSDEITSNRSTRYLIGSGPVLLYGAVYLFSVNGLYNSLFTHWSYIYINMKEDRESSSGSASSKTSASGLLDAHSSSPSGGNDEYSSDYPIRCNRRLYVKNRRMVENLKENGSGNGDGNRSGDGNGSSSSNSSSITIYQLTDPHIGPVMSVKRLNRICRGIVAKDPDLVLLTGDYFTGEANMDGLLVKALEPLKKIHYKCFACLGNHDMETDRVQQRTVRELRELGIKLLSNESVVYDKIDRVGPIQIVGYDFIWLGDEGRKHMINNVMERNPCPAECGNRRIVLLHDPSCFKYFDDDENVVVFSGHTHGGHCGIVTCGVQWTFLNAFTGLADNGLWQKGKNTNYIHRGQGSRALYGNYVLRCGVPTEQSLIRIEW